MSTVADLYPARTDGNGTTWFRAGASREDGWTSDPAQADPSYRAARPPENGPESPSADPETPAGPETPADDGPPRSEAQGPAECPFHEGDVRDPGQCNCDRPTVGPTTEEDPVTVIDEETGDIVAAPRTTKWCGYPLPPEPPRFQPTFNGWGWYQLPAPQTGRKTGFPRVSTIAGTLDDTYGLSRWARRETAKRIVALAEARDKTGTEGREARELFESLKKAIDTASKVTDIDNALDKLDSMFGGAESRELGEAVHAWLEALDIGQVLYRDVPEMFRPYVDAYWDILRRYALVPVPIYVERIVLNDRGDETVVGTLDRIYLCVTTGELILGDIKTSASLEYSWLPFAVQLALYGWATRMLAVDGSGWEPMPEISKDFAIVMHIPSDQPERSEAVTFDLWWGGEASVISFDTRLRRKEAKTHVPYKHAIPAPSDGALRYAEARLALSSISEAADLDRVWEKFSDIWDDRLTEFGQTLAELL